MSEESKVLGIKTVGRYGELPEPQYQVSFYSGIAPGNSSNFMTNPQIRNAIETTQLFQERLGGITFEINPGATVARMQYYFPLGGRIIETNTRIAEFRGMGIAELMEINAIRQLLHDIPTVQFIQFGNPMKKPHQRQMRRRGLQEPLEDQRIPIKTYLAALRKKIAMDSYRHGNVRKSMTRERRRVVRRRILTRRR